MQEHLMTFRDDDLTYLEEHGLPDLPATMIEDFVTHDQARIWFAVAGSGRTVILLHGGLGNSGNWSYQVPALLAAGYRTVVVDSRGQGRSGRDDRPYSYYRMAADVRAVMDRLEIDRAVFIGWSDGADTALALAEGTPDRVNGILFFACNVDSSGTKPFEFTPVIGRIFQRHVDDYTALSPTPDGFKAMSEALEAMQRTQPEYTADDLGRINVPVLVVIGERDEFIKLEHMAYLALALRDATLQVLPEVSHFAPLQRPATFNAVMLDFIARVVSE
jgi:pimeloyl-ACP methyl ester carboxylesterase